MSDRTHTHDADPVRDSDLTRSSAEAKATLGEPALPGSAPPGYELLGELGRGGIGIVYQARQERLNRTVALKMLRGAELSGAAERSRFLAEAEAVAAVRHPHVVQVFEVGDHNGLPFLALEYLAGGTLAERLKRDGARLDTRAAAELVSKLAAAVQAVHEQGIVHRDLKPSNVLFDEAGLPKVADFGLAKRGTSDLTKTQAVMGTPAYMSPEQAKGETKFVGPTADVWALGVILYECLTGKGPFEADDTWAILQKVIHTEPVPLRKLVPEVPRDLELIALKCLSKDPHHRYATAAALADDLNRFLANQPVSVRPAGIGERLVKWGRRNPAVAGLLASLAAVVAVAFTAVTWALLRAEERSRDLGKANDEITGAFNALKASEDSLSDSIAKLKQSQVSLTRTEREASLRAEEAESRSYLSDVSLAQQLWWANDFRGMREVLDRCPPHRRQWEWRYLDNLTRPLLEVIPTESLPVGLAYSPDGSLLASVTLDGTLTLRDAMAKRDCFRLPTVRRGNPLVTPTFRPDGRELAYTTGDAVRVVDPASGRFFEMMPKPGSSDGQVIALGYTRAGRLRMLRQSNQGQPAVATLRVFEVGVETPLATAIGYEEPDGISLQISSAAFNPDASRVAVMVVDSGIRYSRTATVPVASGKKSEPPEAKNAPKPEPKIAGLVRPQMLVFDAASGNLLGKSEGANSRFADIAFDAHSDLVAFGRVGFVVESIPGTVENTRPGHIGQVNAVAFDNRRRLWSGCDGGLVQGHPIRAGQDTLVLRGCPFPVLRLATSAKGTEIAAGTGHLSGSGGAICRFDVRDAERDHWRAEPGEKRLSLIAALGADGRFAAVEFQMEPKPGQLVEDTARFLIADPIRGTEVECKAAMNPRAAFLPGGGCVAADNSGFRVYGPKGDFLRSIPMPRRQVGMDLPGLVAVADGRSFIYVLPGSTQGDAGGQPKSKAFAIKTQSVNVATGTMGPLHTIDLLPHLAPEVELAYAIPGGCALDPSGRIAAVAVTVFARKKEANAIQTFGVVLAWDAATGKEVFRHVGTEGQMHGVAFDSAGRLFAAGGTSTGGRVIGWDLATKAELYSLRAHTRPVMALAFGPDGRLATGGADGQIKLWDVASKWEVLTLDGFPREVGHLAFTPEGHLVAATGFDLLALMMANGPPSDWVPAEVRVYRTGP